ncbi:hypothetical protein AURDEDRAFT_126224 [Auricularia subglabra TFB-10046 SS5]|nr:hypothetical protein AURDEDRAFT_126224 [Auricularia subglabra TFB-10046 SS5]
MPDADVHGVLGASFARCFELLARDATEDKESLLEMALGRSAQHPVVIRNCPEPTRPASVVQILTAHMSHIQHLELPRRVSPAALIHHAPHLRYLKIQTNCRIRPDFLGGCVGQLTTLSLRSVIFSAEICPALSTVTDLSLHPPYDPDHDHTYRPLFRLFPALQALSLQELEFQDTGIVPDGPAPASLRRLSLKTSQTQFDVCECYANWESVTPNLSHVVITQYSPPEGHLRHIVSGAVELNIRRKRSHVHWRMDIVAVGPRERRREVTFWSTSDDSALVAQTLVDVRSALEDVTSFDVSANSLTAFLYAIAALPKLAHLTVTYPSDNSELGEHNPLSSFAHVPEHCPRLQSIVVNVVSSEEKCPPSADDASALLSQLESISNVQLPALVVKGFPSDITSGIHVPHFDGFHVAFENGEGMDTRISDPWEWGKRSAMRGDEKGGIVAYDTPELALAGHVTPPPMSAVPRRADGEDEFGKPGHGERARDSGNIAHSEGALLCRGGLDPDPDGLEGRRVDGCQHETVGCARDIASDVQYERELRQEKRLTHEWYVRVEVNLVVGARRHAKQKTFVIPGTELQVPRTIVCAENELNSVWDPGGRVDVKIHQSRRRPTSFEKFRVIDKFVVSSRIEDCDFSRAWERREPGQGSLGDAFEGELREAGENGSQRTREAISRRECTGEDAQYAEYIGAG